MDPTVFRKAAEEIASEDQYFGCIAISSSLTPASLEPLDNPEVILFEDLLKPPKTHTEAWYGLAEIESNQLARTLGLLLCAEILEDVYNESV